MKKYLFLCIILSLILALFTISEYVRFNDGKFHVVFCDVGQGDAVLIRSIDQNKVIYDAGPDDKLLSCLSRHTPFWEKDIDLFILSHPHLDHFAGTFGLLDKYKISNFGTENVDNPISIYQELKKKIRLKQIPLRIIKAGDSFEFSDGLRITVVGPDADYIDKTSPNGKIGENKEFASLILLVEYKSLSILLTGDSQASGISDAMSQIKLKDIDVLQAPHHGSNTGLTEDILRVLNPEAAVISVGVNKYGHPGKKIIEMLSNQKIQIFRTDLNGDIEIVGSEDKIEVKVN